MGNLNESYDPSDSGETPVSKNRNFINANYERLNVHGTTFEKLDEVLRTLSDLVRDNTERQDALENAVKKLAMKVLEKREVSIASDQASKRAKQIERDAKLLVAVLVADFKAGLTKGIPIEAGVLTESLGFKRPTDVYLDVEKKGL